MARYGQGFGDQALARLLPPESAATEVVLREAGAGAGTLERRRVEARCRHARSRGLDRGGPASAGANHGGDGYRAPEFTLSRVTSVYHGRTVNRMDVRRSDAPGLNRGFEEGTIPFEISS